MDLIIKPRGFGKTTDLINLSEKNNIPILTAGYGGYIKDKRNVAVFNIEDLMSGEICRQGYNKVYIDEIVSFVRCLLEKYGVSPEIGTLSIQLDV